MSKRIITVIVLLSVSIVVTERSSAKKRDSAAVRTAVEKSLPSLDSIRVPFIEKTGCISCHHNSLPAMAIGLARERGFKLNDRASVEESELTIGIWSAGREKLLQGEGMAGGHILAGHSLMGLAANKQSPNKITDALVHLILSKQNADGRWPELTNRPPLNGSDIMSTALCLRALQLYAPKGLREETTTRVQRARTWLAKAIPRNNEDRAFQLLGLAWANGDKQTLQKMGQALLAEQHKDGGWGQHLTMESDAYATGQALVALHQAGGLPVTSRAYQRGVQYLLAQQAADGSWMVVTRSFPFQKYFESGFPYGDNQWISAAASSWATMALALTVERL
jgi:Prenyltransferase and squalene oxidase repeat